MSAISEISFAQITDSVIKELEGGYYHPLMMVDGRLKYNAQLVSSGETMFGIDRKNGAKALQGSQAWIDFWSAIDKAGAKTRWKWNYRGGNLEGYLQNLASQVMFPHFTRLFTKYLSDASQAIVAANPALKLHFAYAAWNGEGWFKQFADAFNARVRAGERNPSKLITLAVQDRTKSKNSLIRQTGLKIAFLVNAMSGGSPAILPLALALFFFGI